MSASITPIELEERRRRRMSLALLAGVLVAGVAISNERALFSTSLFDEVAAAATIRALAAVPATPWQALGVPRIYPIHRAGQAVPPPLTPPSAFAARVPSAPAPSDQVSPLMPPDGVPFVEPPLPPVIGPPPLFPAPPPGPPPLIPEPPVINPPPPVSPVPEPSVWAMIILGFGCIGGMLRLANRRVARAEARIA